MGWKYSLEIGQQAAIEIASNPEFSEPAGLEMAETWNGFKSDYLVPSGTEEVELKQRRASYPNALLFNAEKTTEIIVAALPSVLFWDALIMMLIGMALFKWSILDASKSTKLYIKLMIIGFGTGLLINSWEVL